MKIIARKPCSFNGENYFIGEEIPEESVKDPVMQEKMGKVALVHDSEITGLDIVGEVAYFRVPIMKDGEIMKLEISEDQIAEALQIMQMGQKDAMAYIKNTVDDNTVLITVNAVDSRVAVKKEAEIKAKEIAGMEKSEGDA